MAKTEIKKKLSSAHLPTNKQQMADKDRIEIGGVLSVSRIAFENKARQYHIRRLVLFGSVARGQSEPGSDIDLLVEFKKGKAPSLGGMVKMKDEFSALFGGHKVDIATPAILNNPYRRREIERDMEELYAA